MRKLMLILASGILFAATPALAQEYVIPSIWGNGLLGQSALEHTRRTTEEAGKSSRSKPPVKKTASAGCSADALPAADRRRMEQEYVRRAKADGKASADAWVREQGKRFHQKLVAQGVCPAPGQKTRVAQRKSDDGKGCSMRVVPVANFGGGMTMTQVPDCGDD